jgi:two-component system, OmpR family, sensor kinase
MMRDVLHPRSWPLALKVPLLVAFLMIAVAVVVSHVVLQSLAEDQETNLRQLTESYLDGLSTALLPNVLRHDVWETFDILDRAKERYSGVKDRFTIVTLADGTVLAASDPTSFPVGKPLPADLAERFSAGQRLVLDEARGLAWAHRGLQQEGIDLGDIFAEIDISDLLRVRREVLVTLILANGGLALLLAALGYGLVRRMVHPISLLTEHVDRMRDGAVVEIPDRHLQDQGTEFGRLFASFNAMAAALREREALAQRLAEEEKAAILGKLASGMAHEVNNPLGGMLNLVDTLRSHGQDNQVRRRSLDLLERGLIGIRNVVRATLATYKGEQQPRNLGRSDIDDLQFLVQHELNRRHVRLAWDNQLEGDLEIDATSVRQIALNLLLNACAASPESGAVVLRVTAPSDDLSLTVTDEGPGLPSDVYELYRNPRLATQPPRGSIGLGVWTTCHLVSRLSGRIEVKSQTGSGTEIAVILPLARERKLDAVA